MKQAPEYFEGRQAYRDGKSLEDSPYNRPRGLCISGRTAEQIERDYKAGEWYRGYVDSHAEWAEGKQDQSKEVE